MTESNLKSLLWSGKQIEFDFNLRRYTVKLVHYAFNDEYAFGEKYGRKTTSSYFDDIYFMRENGYSLAEMLSRVSSSQIYIY